MINLMIADDHQMFIDGLSALIEKIENITCIATANNGQELLKLIEENKPHVVLLDVNMPVLDGLETLKEITQKYPEVKVIMVTMQDSVHYIEKLLRAGAMGYILKNTGKLELKLAIETVFEGKTFYSQEVTQLMMNGFSKRKQIQNDLMNVELTERELDVLKLIVAEYTTNEIGEKLCISPHTVETHRKNLISKLQVRNSAGLVKYAVEMGLV